MQCQNLKSIDREKLNTSYICVGSCANGFLKDNIGACQDIDECQDSKACPFGVTCKNLIGSYTCDCHQGYIFTYKGCEGKLILIIQRILNLYIHLLRKTF